jgi:hypothetical protein
MIQLIYRKGVARDAFSFFSTSRSPEQLSANKKALHWNGKMAFFD